MGRFHIIRQGTDEAFVTYTCRGLRLFVRVIGPHIRTKSDEDITILAMSLVMRKLNQAGFGTSGIKPASSLAIGLKRSELMQVTDSNTGCTEINPSSGTKH